MSRCWIRTDMVASMVRYQPQCFRLSSTGLLVSTAPVGKVTRFLSEFERSHDTLERSLGGSKDGSEMAMKASRR